MSGVLHIIVVTVVSVIAFYLYFEIIVSYHRRHQLGLIIYPKRKDFDEYNLIFRWRTTEHVGYRVAVFIAYASLAFVAFSWFYNIWIEKNVIMLVLTVLPYALLFNHIIEVREEGMLIDGLYFRWEDIQTYELDDRGDRASLTFVLKKRKYGLKRFRSRMVPAPILREVDKQMARYLTKKEK
jgi:hypothetical protein